MDILNKFSKMLKIFFFWSGYRSSHYIEPEDRVFFFLILPIHLSHLVKTHHSVYYGLSESIKSFEWLYKRPDPTAFYLIVRNQLNTYAQCLLYLTACIQLDMRTQTAVKFQRRQEVKPDGVSVGG